jgi:hypothetical protein
MYVFAVKLETIPKNKDIVFGTLLRRHSRITKTATETQIIISINDIKK